MMTSINTRGQFPLVPEYAPALKASQPIPGDVACLLMIDIDAPMPTNVSFPPLPIGSSPALLRLHRIIQHR